MITTLKNQNAKKYVTRGTSEYPEETILWKKLGKEEPMTGNKKR